jgi:putative transposase
MIEKGHSDLSTAAQCRLLGITRSTLYYKPPGEDAENLYLMRLLDEQYLITPFYGVRKLRAWLKHEGHVVNRKRLRRLMGLMGWQTIYRAP